MDRANFQDVLERYPELKAGLPDHVDEVLRIVARVIEMEANPWHTRPAPELPPDAAEWERDYWRRRAERLPT